VILCILIETSVFNGLTVGGSNVLTEADPAIVRRRGTITSQDWNTYIDGTEAGWYQVNNASGSNKPPAYTYGTQLNFSTSSANKLQIYAPHNATLEAILGLLYFMIVITLVTM
jgi:hypothetical protein